MITFDAFRLWVGTSFMSLSAEAALSIIVTLVIVVLDKAGKLTPTLQIGLLALAAALAIRPLGVVLAFGRSMSTAWSIWRWALAISLDLLVFAAIGIWIWPAHQAAAQSQNTATVTPNREASKMSESHNQTFGKHEVQHRHLIREERPHSATAEPKTVISAPNGIAIGGGVVNNPTVNNYATPAPATLEAEQQGRSVILSAVGGPVEPVSVGLIFDTEVRLLSRGNGIFMMTGDSQLTGRDGRPDSRTISLFWQSPALTPGRPVTITFASDRPATLIKMIRLPFPF